MRDGSVLAQLSQTDMKVPIQYALTYPEREASPLPSLDLDPVGALEFHRVDERKFPLFSLARTVLEEGESLPVALNAANEVVVEAFLAGRIRFGASGRARGALPGGTREEARPGHRRKSSTSTAKPARRTKKILKQRT